MRCIDFLVFGRGRRIPYSASLRCKFVLRSTTAFCKAKTPNVAPVHRFAVSGSHDQASYKKQKSRCVASTFLFLAGAGGFEPATHGFGVDKKARKPLKILAFSHVSKPFSRKTVCRDYVWKILMLFWCYEKILPYIIAVSVILMLFKTQNLHCSKQRKEPQKKH